MASWVVALLSTEIVRWAQETLHAWAGGGCMSSYMPSWQACQDDCPGVVVQKMIRHRRVAQAPVCTLPLLYPSCLWAVPIIPLPGITLPGFVSGHGGEWFHRSTEKPWYQSQLLTLHRVSRAVYSKRPYSTDSYWIGKSPFFSAYLCWKYLFRWVFSNKGSTTVRYVRQRVLRIQVVDANILYSCLENEVFCDNVLLSQTNTRELYRGELGHGLHTRRYPK